MRLAFQEIDTFLIYHQPHTKPGVSEKEVLYFPLQRIRTKGRSLATGPTVPFQDQALLRCV